jgi:hypothetical protein
MGNVASELVDVPPEMNGNGVKGGDISTLLTDTDEGGSSLGEQPVRTVSEDKKDESPPEGIEAILDRTKTLTQKASDDICNIENTENNTSIANVDRVLNEKAIGVSKTKSGSEEPEPPLQTLSTTSASSIKQDVTMEELCITVEEGEEIDMAYVTEYERCFNEFVAEHPEFMIRNPNLLHNLRVCKLQKALEYAYNTESELSSSLGESQAKKQEMTTSYHVKLREASRNKAAREIHLQEELNTIQQATRVMEGRLTWQMIVKSEVRTKKYLQMQQQLALQPVDPGNLLAILPDQPAIRAVRDAATAPAGANLSEEQEKDLRQFQVDNAFLSAEVTVLEKKLAYQVVAAKKHAWVDSVFMLMDPKKLKRLKNRYQKKLGVTF